MVVDTITLIGFKWITAIIIFGMIRHYANWCKELGND